MPTGDNIGANGYRGMSADEALRLLLPAGPLTLTRARRMLRDGGLTRSAAEALVRQLVAAGSLQLSPPATLEPSSSDTERNQAEDVAVAADTSEGGCAGMEPEREPGRPRVEPTSAPQPECDTMPAPAGDAAAAPAPGRAAAKASRLPAVCAFLATGNAIAAFFLWRTASSLHIWADKWRATTEYLFVRDHEALFVGTAFGATALCGASALAFIYVAAASRGKPRQPRVWNRQSVAYLVLTLGMLAFILAGVFPPWRLTVKEQSGSFKRTIRMPRSHSIFNPPSAPPNGQMFLNAYGRERPVEATDSGIDTRQLAVEWVLILLPTGVLFALVKPWRRASHAPQTRPPTPNG